MDFIDRPMAAVSDGRFIICANWITRMPSIVFDVVEPKLVVSSYGK